MALEHVATTELKAAEMAWEPGRDVAVIELVHDQVYLVEVAPAAPATAVPVSDRVTGRVGGRSGGHCGLLLHEVRAGQDGLVNLCCFFKCLTISKIMVV